MKPFKTIITAAILFAFTQLPVCTFAQVANGTGAGNCLSFNSISDYVEIADNNTLSALSPLTVSAWIKTTAPGWQGIVSKHGSLTNNREFILAVSIDNLIFSIYDNSAGNVYIGRSDAINSYTDGKWHHITGTWDGGTNPASSIKVYVDGVRVDNTSMVNGSFNNINDTPSTLNIGLWEIGEHFFSGQIDEVRIYNRVLTQDEIRANMCKKLLGTENGLVGYWRFDEGSGSTVYDASPNGNNGTLH